MTVLGTLVVTLKVNPAPSVSDPAIPRTALAPMVTVRDALMAILNKLTVPEMVEVPSKVIVPALAASDPATERCANSVMLRAVVIVPGTFNELNVSGPAPEMVLAAPVIETVPPLAIKEPLTERLPAIA